MSDGEDSLDNSGGDNSGGDNDDDRDGDNNNRAINSPDTAAAAAAKDDEDDDDEGMPRKTMVTAMIRRKTDAANADIPGRGIERADNKFQTVLEPHIRSFGPV